MHKIAWIISEKVQAGDEASRDVPPPFGEPVKGESLEDMTVEVEVQERAFQGDQVEEVGGELEDAAVTPSESRQDKGGSPRKPTIRRHADTPDKRMVRLRQDLEDRTVEGSESRTRDDVTGFRNPAQRRTIDPPNAKPKI